MAETIRCPAFKADGPQAGWWVIQEAGSGIRYGYALFEESGQGGWFEERPP
jgi:hypothetical protein